MRVSDLFKSDLFPDFKLLAGREGLDNEVCQVSILDSPDFCNWIQGGDLVIGNGYAFRDSPEKFPVFLKSLVEHNAAALGMKFDRFRFAYNYDEIIELADRYNFPLIEVPFRYTWNMIFDEIYRKNRAVPGGMLGNISDVLSVIEERMDPVDLVYALSSKMKREMYIYSPKLQLCHHIDDQSHDNVPSEAEQFRKSTVIERMHPHNIGSIAISTLTKNIDGKPLKFASYRICNIEICVRLHSKEDMLPAQSEKSVINTLLLLYLMVMDEVLIHDSERKKLNALLERVLAGRYTDPDTLFSQFKNMRLSFPLPCVVLLFYQADMAVIQREIQPITPINCLLGEQMILFLSPKEFVEKQEGMRKIVGKNEILGVYSDIVQNIEDISHAFSEVREGMAWIKRLAIPVGLCSYYDVLLKIGISRFAELGEASAIVKRYWEPLKEAKPRNAVSLELFATKLIEANFNLAQTSQSLNVHYNTARNYLEELERGLGVSLVDAESRFLLMLARYIDNMNQSTSSVREK